MKQKQLILRMFYICCHLTLYRLLALRQVIYALTSKQKGVHVPYRDSKLTRMLQNSFGGNAHTALVINCSPNSFNVQETISTLRFGSRTRQITNLPKANKHRTAEELTRLLDKAHQEIDEKDTYIKQLHREIISLRAANRSNNTGGDFMFDYEFKQLFMCPMSGRPLNEPVLALDGYTYDKFSITRYFNEKLKKDSFVKSPMTDQRLTSRNLIPNYFVKRQYDYLTQRYGEDAFMVDESQPLFWTIQVC
jgi:hypothetical protein